MLQTTCEEKFSRKTSPPYVGCVARQMKQWSISLLNVLPWLKTSTSAGDDEVARILHWKLCQKWGFESAERWYNHKPECVLENDDCKMLWDFPIQTDKEMEHNKPDITVVDKKNKVTLLIDPTCPFDTRISQKEEEKTPTIIH